jgi:uncharacterized glyoxalase superfamily protein PhnB
MESEKWSKSGNDLALLRHVTHRSNLRVLSTRARAQQLPAVLQSMLKRGSTMTKLCRIAPELPVSNLHEAIKDYEQQLGFQVAMQTPNGDYAIVERDDIAIHLFQDNANVHTPVAIHIFSPDLDALYAEFQQSGARVTQGILRKPWGNRDFRLKDTFGNELKFTEPLQEG